MGACVVAQVTIPLLSIPVISRPDLLARCIASIDVSVGRLVVIDNSPTGGYASVVEANVPDCVDDWFVCEPPANLGVAASWNLAIRTAPDVPWWCIANADTEVGPGDLARLAAEMDKGGARWVGMNGDWRVFGITRSVIERVGWFDENYHPIYCEDADYERRCTLADVDWYSIPGGASHAGSATIAEDRYRRENDRTYPANVAYHVAKWGGPPRRGLFLSPFDAGGSVSEWTLDLRRLRANTWEAR